jgi:hypothetical protein
MDCAIFGLIRDSLLLLTWYAKANTNKSTGNSAVAIGIIERFLLQ